MGPYAFSHPRDRDFLLAVGAPGSTSFVGCNSLTAEQTAFNGELDGLHASLVEYYTAVSFGILDIPPEVVVYDVGGDRTFVMDQVKGNGVT